jgi:hypothetical protein
MNGDQARHPAPLLVMIPHGMAGALGRDHDHVHVGGRDHRLEMNVEAVGHGEVVARLEVGRHLVRVDVPAELIGYGQHDQVGLTRGVRHGRDPQTRALGLRPARRVLAQTDDHLDARGLQVLRVRMPLGSVSDDRDLAGLNPTEIRVLVIVDVECHVRFFSRRSARSAPVLRLPAASFDFGPIRVEPRRPSPTEATHQGRRRRRARPRSAAV